MADLLLCKTCFGRNISDVIKEKGISVHWIIAVLKSTNSHKARKVRLYSNLIRQFEPINQGKDFIASAYFPDGTHFVYSVIVHEALAQWEGIP